MIQFNSEMPADKTITETTLPLCRKDVFDPARPDQIGYWEDVFMQVGNVSRAETEDRDNYMKFKYAAGRNWRKLEQLRKQTAASVDRLLAPSDAYQKFMKDRESLLASCAVVDADGDPQMEKRDDGRNYFVFDAEGHAKAEALMVEHRKAHAEVVEEQLRKQEQTTAYLADELQVALYTVPWAWVPERISGAYLQAVELMCVDAPAFDVDK